jgi:hypothetical protein
MGYRVHTYIKLVLLYLLTEQKVESIMLELLIVKWREGCSYVAGKRSGDGYNLSYIRHRCNDFPQDTYCNYLIGVYLIIVGVWAIIQAL